MTEQPASDRAARWEQRTAWPLAVATVLYLAAYAWPILEPRLGAPWSDVCTTVATVTWAPFAVDFLVRLYLAPRRGAFLLRSPIDVVTLLLPALRPLRLLRVVRVLRIVTSLGRIDRHAAGAVRGQVAAYTVVATSLVLFVGALAVLDAERGAPGANITTFGDALWWAVTTISTVGYGDVYPVTVLGRFVAAGVMVAGLALIGVVSAGLVSWLVDRVRAEQEPATDPAEHARALRALTAEVEALRHELGRRRDP